MKRSMTALAAAVAVLVGCSSESEPITLGTVSAPGPVGTAPVTAPAAATIVTTPAPSPPSAADGACAVNSSTVPVAAVEPYATVPEEGRISVALNGIPSGSLSPGASATEVDVRLCNDSAVDFPDVGVVLVLGHCTFADNPMSMPTGSIERFDEDAGDEVPVAHPVAGTGMDYLGGYSNVLTLSEGQAVTVRYRVSLDASMTPGDGALEAEALTPDPLDRLGSADLGFAVLS